MSKTPNQFAALEKLQEAYCDLKRLGFQDIIYCPKDGSIFEVIEAGSTGVHDCYYEGTWPDGHWNVVCSDGDEGSSYPILWRMKREPER